MNLYKHSVFIDRAAEHFSMHSVVFDQLNVWVGGKYHAPLILQKSANQGVNG
jgi:hypothetical protein